MFRSKRNHQQRQRFEDEALVHLDSLYGMALRLTRHDRDAEDLVQDALVRAYRAFDRFEPGTNIKGWLFKILTNTFYNARRKAGTIARLHHEAEVGNHHHRFVSSASALGAHAEASVLDRLGLEKIRQALDELPETFRIVVALSDLHEFSYREIAEIVDCPIGTVMSRLHRGRQLLRSKLCEEAQAQGLIRQDEQSSEQQVAAEAPHQPTDLNAYRQQRGER